MDLKKGCLAHKTCQEKIIHGKKIESWEGPLLHLHCVIWAQCFEFVLSQVYCTRPLFWGEANNIRTIALAG